MEFMRVRFAATISGFFTISLSITLSNESVSP